jgi:hypothetical protein
LLIRRGGSGIDWSLFVGCSLVGCSLIIDGLPAVELRRDVSGGLRGSPPPCSSQFAQDWAEHATECFDGKFFSLSVR